MITKTLDGKTYQIPEEPACRKRTIKEFSKNKIVFSDGAVITSDTGEFDQAVIEAILKAGD